MRKSVFILILFIVTVKIQAQCPTVICPPALSLTTCQGGQTISATSNYSANITSRWIGPGNIPIASAGTSTSIVKLNHIGTYTVVFKDNLSNCIIMDSIKVSDITNKPTFGLSVSSYSMLCTSSRISMNIINAVATPFFPGGSVSYTIIGSPTTSTIPIGTLSPSPYYTVGSCGNWELIVRNNSSSCYSSFIVPIACSTLAPTPLNINGPSTVCLGSSVTYTSTGNNLAWNTGATGPVMNNTPSVSTVYSVSGIDANGCPSSGAQAVTVNNTCSQVWPGDANNDGLVDNADILELGLAFNATGPARTPGGSAYTSQFAANWTGMVSTGKNLCHADCNGDGIITNADTLAITANFLLPHSFKTFLETSNNPDIAITSQPIINAGLWNKADIFLGDASNSVSQLYGLSFDLNYDQSLIESDSLYIVYTNSFLNTNGQNIEFRKTVFNSGKLYGASVRTDGSDMSGSGKIAEVYFKIKYGLPENSILTLALSNTKKIDHTGLSTSLSAGSSSMLIDANTVGLKETKNAQTTSGFYPNPANDHITLLSRNSALTKYSIIDINGKILMEGEFSRSHSVDIQALQAGTYFIGFNASEGFSYKKLMISK